MGAVIDRIVGQRQGVRSQISVIVEIEKASMTYLAAHCTVGEGRTIARTIPDPKTRPALQSKCSFASGLSIHHK